MRRLLILGAMSLLTVLGSPSDVDAAQASFEARLSCRSEPTPGRVTCELELEVDKGRIAWADALVVKAPDFARPLRSRIALSEATARSEKRLRLPIALVATLEGHGELVVSARAVLCPTAGNSRCRSVRREAKASVDVGAK